jgi:DNA polymerase III delta prime subunit
MSIEARLTALVVNLRAAVNRRSNLGEDAGALVALLEVEYPLGSPTEDDSVAGVAERFGLTDLDGALLTVAAAGELDPRFAAMYGVLLGSDRWTPTLGLALELCGEGTLSPDARHRLGPSAPLRRHRLITVESSGPALLRPLSVPERVVGHLLGDPAPDPEIAALTVRVPSRCDDVAERLARAFRSGAAIGHVRARPGTTGLASAQGAFELLGLGALVVDVARLGRPGDSARLAGLAVREAGLQGVGLVVTGADASLTADRTVLTEIEDAPLPIVVVDDVAWESTWYRGPLLSVDATLLTLDERAEIWRTAVDPDELDEADGVEWLNLVGLRMTPEHIASAVRSAAVAAATAALPVTIDRLHEAAREQGRVRLEGAGVRSAPQATLSDLILPATTRQSLEELIAWARNREALLTAGRLTGRGTKGHGLTAMFAGSAGTGKTLAAEAIAGELGLELCTVDLSLVVDKYIGETEKHLEQVISEAENLNVVLFFDEADSLFGSRSAVTDSRDRYANQEVAYLLQRIERFEGLAVLATNLRGNLDPAFTRRLHHIITFTDPDADTRRGLWKAHLDEVSAFDPADPLDHDWLAESVELAGGDIRNIVMTAAFAAAAEQNVGLTAPRPAPVGMRHVMYAVEREYRKQAKRMPPAP